jgi:sulfonate transport system substrate-binding protein
MYFFKFNSGARSRRATLPGIHLLAAFLLILSPMTRASTPDVVRIASIGTMEKGKVWVTSQSTRVQAEGWLEKQLRDRGIRLEWVPVSTSVGGPAFNEALANRSVDFASYGDLPALIARGGGIDIRLIVPYGGGGNSYLSVPPDSTARSIVDLKGKRIALQRGRPAELPFTKLLDAHGLKMSDFRILNLPAQSASAALIAGDADAYFGGSDAFLFQDKGLAKIIWSTKTKTAGREIDWKTRVDLFVRGDFADKYPQITQLVATAYVRSSHWTAQERNRDAVVNIYARPGTPKHVVERDFASESTVWKNRWSPLFDPFLFDYYQTAISMMQEKKLIRKPVSVASLFDDRFVKRAIQELQIDSFWEPRTKFGAALE